MQNAFFVFLCYYIPEITEDLAVIYISKLKKKKLTEKLSDLLKVQRAEEFWRTQVDLMSFNFHLNILSTWPNRLF